jgi:uroporphyrinogen-III decarboxylase
MDFSPSVYEHAAGLIGKTPWEVSRDRELMVKAHQAAYESYHYTPITVGVDIYNVESAATPPLLSPKQFETILLPVLKDMLQEIKTITNEAPALVIGGDTAPILDYVLKTTAGYVICPSETDQQVFMEKIWNHSGIRVRVNMDAKIVVFGSREEIQKEVERIYTLAAQRPNVCLRTGVLPYGTPPENVLFIENVLQRLE